MGLGPPRGHLKHWRRRIALQLGQSGGDLSPEFSPRLGVRELPSCWGSALQLTQCLQHNPREEKIAGLR